MGATEPEVTENEKSPRHHLRYQREKAAEIPTPTIEAMKKTANKMKPPSAADGRRTRGRFTPGTSGNPQGRPKSESVALRQALAEGAADVVSAILKAAKAGDMQAARIVLDRLVPPLKANAQTVRLALPESASPLGIAKAILAATASGTLAPDIAAQLVTAVGTFCRIEEVEELRDRIAALEIATRPTSITQKKKP